jgi:hypothetical protein
MSNTRRRTTRPGNKGFDEWGEAFGDDVMAGALIDRVVHHCHIVNICGNSYPRPATRGWGSSTRPQVGEFQVAARGADITYVPTWAGFPYLAIVFDA